MAAGLRAVKEWPLPNSSACTSPDEHDVSLADVLAGVGGEEQVAAAASLDDLEEAGLVDGQMLAVPRLDALLVDVHDHHLRSYEAGNR